MSTTERLWAEACVSTALKRRSRKLRTEDLALGAAIGIGSLALWYLKLDEPGVWWVGMLVALLYFRTERRLKTMQIRLARMHDLLHRIAGDQVFDEELMELVSEDGPVAPGPKLWPG